MFEKFTREARDAVVGAQRVARDAGSRTIDTRHVLTALAEADGPPSRALRDAGVDTVSLSARLRSDLRAGGIDTEALASVGIDLEAVRERTDEVFGRDALARAGRSPGRMPFASEAKKALQLALREAVRLKARSITGAHLLLGILRAESAGRDALLEAGADLDAVRRALEQPGAPGSRSA